MAFSSGRGQGIDTLGERNSCRRVSNASRLGIVVIGREEVVLYVVEARAGLLYEGDPTVPSGLGQFLLGDGDQAAVSSVANGALAELSVRRDWAKQDEAACNIGDLFWMVDVDTATEEEVDNS